NGGKNSLNRLIRCVCGKKIGPDPRNFNQRVSLGRNDLLIRTFPRVKERYLYVMALISIRYSFFFMGLIEGRRILNPGQDAGGGRSGEEGNIAEFTPIG
ncbi:hypothetical protein ACV8U7_13505, partial [Citrobacter freundii]